MNDDNDVVVVLSSERGNVIIQYFSADKDHLPADLLVQYDLSPRKAVWFAQAMLFHARKAESEMPKL